MNFRDEIKYTLIDEAVSKGRTYDLGDSLEMDSLFKKHEDTFHEKYGHGYDTRFCEMVDWCVKRYSTQIETIVFDL